MRNLPLQFGFFGAGLLSLLPLSAQAQLTVNATQNAAISGDNNQITQVVNQTIIYRSKNTSKRSFFKKDDDDREDRGRKKGWGDRHDKYDKGLHKGHYK
ncbi:hypothetical protein [Altericista sp. CCNU0014]|uniref:hypothetical protein n=1 Tax=Altericista sp. CCNU0014 TaxID=3082949 RepID=UPI00384DA3EE